jgi:peroxiredoxin
MKAIPYLVGAALVLSMTSIASSQNASAPNITGTSIQGSAIDLASFKGQKNVLVVFYRMHT